MEGRQGVRKGGKEVVGNMMQLMEVLPVNGDLDYMGSEKKVYRTLVLGNEGG